MVWLIKVQAHAVTKCAKTATPENACKHALWTRTEQLHQRAEKNYANRGGGVSGGELATGRLIAKSNHWPENSAGGITVTTAPRGSGSSQMCSAGFNEPARLFRSFSADCTTLHSAQGYWPLKVIFSAASGVKVSRYWAYIRVHATACTKGKCKFDAIATARRRSAANPRWKQGRKRDEVTANASSVSNPLRQILANVQQTIPLTANLRWGESQPP